MTGIVYAAVTLGVSLAAWVFGRHLGRGAGRAWLWVYAAGLLLAMAIGLGRRFPWLEFHPPFQWLMAGRTEYALIGPITGLILGATAPRLPRLRDRRGVLALAAAVILDRLANGRGLSGVTAAGARAPNPLEENAGYAETGSGWTHGAR